MTKATQQHLATMPHKIHHTSSDHFKLFFFFFPVMQLFLNPITFLVLADTKFLYHLIQKKTILLKSSPLGHLSRHSRHKLAHKITILYPWPSFPSQKTQTLPQNHKNLSSWPPFPSYNTNSPTKPHKSGTDASGSEPSDSERRPRVVTTFLKHDPPPLSPRPPHKANEGHIPNRSGNTPSLVHHRACDKRFTLEIYIRMIVNKT